MEDPETTYISPEVIIGKDTVIMPNTSIIGRCEIGENNTIGPNAYIEDSIIGSDNRIFNSTLVRVKISNEKIVEPYTYMVDDNLL